MTAAPDPPVHPSIRIAFNAYLEAASLEMRARELPNIAPAFQIKAELKRTIARAALRHVTESGHG